MLRAKAQDNRYRWYEEPNRVVKRQFDPSIPKISIVVPTLNMQGTIEGTILSIIRQDDENYELIVIDGGSTDGTEEVIQKYNSYITYYESKPDNGQSSAINRGFEIATGDFYAWINSDDFYLPNAFRVVREVFKESDDVDIVVGSGDVVTQDCKFLKHISGLEMSRDNLLNWNNDQWILQQSCFWTRELWEKSGGVDESLQLLMDYDLWLRFSDMGKSKAIRNSIAIMRYYDGAKTMRLRSKMKEEEAYVYAKNQAFTQLKSLVSELNIKSEELGLRVNEYDCHYIIKILRRIGLL